MSKKFIDMTGWVMKEHGVPESKLTVIDQAEDYINPASGSHNVSWNCICECGNILIAIGTKLRNGLTKQCVTCGHKEAGKNGRRKNRYELSPDGTYAIFYTSKDEPFWVDIEDIEKVQKYCWSYNSHGYLQANSKGTQKSPLFLHRYLMGLKEGDVGFVDHKTHEKCDEKQIDHRKNNLRITTNSENNMNHIVHTTNTSGCSGVYYNKSNKGWVAEIREHNNYHYLGTFGTKDKAIAVRKEAEKKYFGEHAYDQNN